MSIHLKKNRKEEYDYFFYVADFIELYRYSVSCI